VGWTFFWLMVVLKIPIVGLFCIVHWAIKQSDTDELPSNGDGGVRPPHRPRLPKHPRRRGPHGSPGTATVAPRVRRPALTARAHQRP
jgi:hypothetical protein